MKLKNDDQNQSKDLTDVDASGVDNTRRKLGKAGIIAPVLLSLSSKPVWAVECGMSGVMSGNASRTCTNPPNGFSASQLSSASTWPLPFDPGKTTFDSVFPVISGMSLFGTDVTLKKVLLGEADITLSKTDLMKIFKCKGDDKAFANLKTALKNYAIQSIVSLLNDALFPTYAYQGADKFWSSIASTSGSSCTDKTQAIKNATDILSKLTT